MDYHIHCSASLKSCKNYPSYRPLDERRYVIRSLTMILGLCEGGLTGGTSEIDAAWVRDRRTRESAPIDEIIYVKNKTCLLVLNRVIRTSAIQLNVKVFTIAPLVQPLARLRQQWCGITDSFVHLVILLES